MTIRELIDLLYELQDDDTAIGRGSYNALVGYYNDNVYDGAEDANMPVFEVRKK